jgi:hypothetical protein
MSIILTGLEKELRLYQDSNTHMQEVVLKTKLML